MNIPFQGDPAKDLREVGFAHSVDTIGELPSGFRCKIQIISPLTKFTANAHMQSLQNFCSSTKEDIVPLSIQLDSMRFDGVFSEIAAKAVSMSLVLQHYSQSAQRMQFKAINFCLCLFLMISMPYQGQSATWYAAATGTGTNGTSEMPWSVPYAVSHNNTHLNPGDTVLFKNGTYVCTETNLPALAYGYQLAFRKSGNPTSKIIYRSESLWGFNFDGGLYIGSGTSNIVLWGFNIYWSGITNRANTNNNMFTGGITEFGRGNEILHNIIGNTGHSGIGSWSSTGGKYIAGNIIRFIGSDDYVNYRPGVPNPAGSGMYLQNDQGTSEALISGNISYFNYTTGMKAYGNTDVYDFNFRHNISALTGDDGGIFYHQNQIDSKGVKFHTNFTWNSHIRLGYSRGQANPSNAVIVGNYSVNNHHNGVFHIEDGWKYCTITNNTFINPTFRYLLSLEATGQTNFVATHFWNYNTYHTGEMGGYGIWNFFVGSDPYVFPEWTNRIKGDTQSSVISYPPVSTDVFPFAPSTDSNFVHIAVYNWLNNEKATVDLSAFYPTGSRLAIYDAQDIPNAYTNLTFDGTTITLDLTRTNRAVMLGKFSKRTDTWQGFDPRFRPFVIYRLPTNSLQSPLNLRVFQ